MNKDIKKSKNLILQQYLASSTNAAVCVDVTKLGINGELFLAIDLASRCIVGHCYKNNAINTQDVCLTIKQFNEQRAFLPNIEIIHSDKGSIFNSQKFLSFLETLNIQHSVGYSKANQNQVIERLNRSIKEILKSILDKDWKKKHSNPLNNLIEPSVMAQKVIQAIEFYNNRPHKALQDLTPNDMEAALFQKHRSQHPSHIQLIHKDNKSLEALAIRGYKDTLIEEYRGNWELFFIDWRAKQEKQHQEVVRLIKEKAEQARIEAEEAKNKFNTMAEQVKIEAAEARKNYNTIYEQCLQLQQQIQYLQKEAEYLQKLREDKEIAKLKKKNAKRMEIRQTISNSDFQFILSLVKGKRFVLERRRLALVLLYLTGLRVSNLLILNVRHVKELVESGKTNISIIKYGAKRQDLVLSQKGQTLLLQFVNDFHVLAEGKTLDMPLFSSIESKDKAISIDNFEKELNSILREASITLEKFMRTHSFRATVITELLLSTPIEDVAEYIGHRSISSTLEYKRSRLSITQIKKISSKRHLTKIDINKKYKK